MEVILLERIERLGVMGQVVKVRPGYARNFLLPQKKALRATKMNLEQFEKQRATLEARNAAERSAAQTLAAKLDGLKLVIIRQSSETGQLYGSVTARDVAEAAKTSSQPIERSQVQIDTPIKTLGLFPVKVRLHPEVSIKITVNIARSQEEAVVQANKEAAATAKAAKKAESGEAELAAEAAAFTEAEAAEKPAKKNKKTKAEEGANEEAAPKAAKAAKASKKDSVADAKPAKKTKAKKGE
ncbi:MAG: 50S ribosomal protein L9 [Bdellovibrionales bacterium]